MLDRVGQGGGRGDVASRGYPPFGSLTTPPAGGEAPLDLGATLRAGLRALRRHRTLLLATIGGVLAVGLVHLGTAVPLYRANASIIVDPRMGPVGADSAPGLLTNDALVVDSEVRVLQSRALTDRVIARLGLMPEEDEARGVRSRLRDLLGRGAADRNGPVGAGALLGDTLRGAEGTAAPTRAGGATAPEDGDMAERDLVLEEARRAERLRRRLTGDLDIARAGETYVIDIAYASPDPVFAATIANAFVEEYFLAHTETQFETTRRMNEWLGERVGVLASAVAGADEAVETYRRTHDLIGADGERLQSEVELAAANEELVQVRASRASVATQLAALAEAIEAGTVDVALGEEARTARLDELRLELGQLNATLLDYAGRLGEDHDLTGRTRAEATRARALIAEELRTVASDLESRETLLARSARQIEERIEAIRARAADDAVRSIRLRELEREAESKRQLFEAMLGRLDETTQEESFAPAPARVIARAVPPDEPASPRPGMILALSLLGGLVMGGGLVSLREIMDESVRMPGDLEALGLPVLGLAPAAPRDADDEVSIMRHAVDHPSGPMAEAVRAIGLAGGIRRTETGGVIGVTGAGRDEGASALALNLASANAARGLAVVLVELDRRGSIGDIIDVPPANRLRALIDDPALIETLAPSATLSGAVPIPFGGSDDGDKAIVLADPTTHEFIAAMLELMRERFDLVVLDLPPLAASLDARVGVRLVDHLVLAVRWGATPKHEVEAALAAHPEARRRCLGAVPTRFDPTRYAAYNGPIEA